MSLHFSKCNILFEDVIQFLFQTNHELSKNKINNLIKARKGQTNSVNFQKATIIDYDNNIVKLLYGIHT